MGRTAPVSVVVARCDRRPSLDADTVYRLPARTVQVHLLRRRDRANHRPAREPDADPEEEQHDRYRHREHIIADVGLWLFDRRTMGPAGVVRRSGPRHQRQRQR
jgi:hypothetical protein